MFEINWLQNFQETSVMDCSTMKRLKAENDRKSSSSCKVLIIVAFAGVLSAVAALKIHRTVPIESGFTLCSVKALIISQ